MTRTPTVIGESTPEQRNHFIVPRLLLASLVIVGHAAELTDGNTSRELFHRMGARLTAGDFAVDAFFVISGYLILQSWSRQPSVRSFLTKRMLRIIPAFLVAYLISVLIVGRIGGGHRISWIVHSVRYLSVLPRNFGADLSLRTSGISRVSVSLQQRLNLDHRV